MKKRRNPVHRGHAPKNEIALVPTNVNEAVHRNVNGAVPRNVNGAVHKDENGAIPEDDPVRRSVNAVILPRNTQNTENARTRVASWKKKRRKSARKILIHIII